MNNTDLIKELRAITQAGMKDCKEALEAANWDLQAAVDLVKVKGLNIADARSGRIAADGLVSITNTAGRFATMVEVNCQTDFVAKNPEFIRFVTHTSNTLAYKFNHSEEFNDSDVEEQRQALVATIKENVVVRRWWCEEAMDPNVKVFDYLHSGKIGVILTLQAPSQILIQENLLNKNKPWFLTTHQEFVKLGEDLAMQIAAMNPLSVSIDRLPPEMVERQKNIFQAQLQELNKPQSSWPKIMEGKMNKWYRDVVLLEQESVICPKMTVHSVISSIESKIGGEIKIVNFIRAEVGEGLFSQKENLIDSVNDLILSSDK